MPCVQCHSAGCRIRFEIAYNFDAVVHAQYVSADCQSYAVENFTFLTVLVVENLLCTEQRRLSPLHLRPARRGMR